MAGGQERELRRRIRSINSTKKITRAMELIAASRIARAQQAIAAARPYVEKMAEVVAHVADTPDGRAHPLFREPETVRKAAIIVIAGDRGLSGAYNSTVIRAAEREMADGPASETMLVGVGRKVVNHFHYRDQDVAAGFTGMAERPNGDDARKVVDAVMEPFLAGELDRISLVYTHFKSAGSQEVRVRTLVPLDLDAVEDGGDAGGRGRDGDGDGEPFRGGHGEGSGDSADYEFEPDPAEILDRLLPAWLQAEVLAALLSASASEHAARQRAMKAATDNADELVKTLSRVMNRARQDAITTEITEIVGGAEALRSGADGDHADTYAPADAGTA